jgi:hypothetical protein
MIETEEGRNFNGETIEMINKHSKGDAIHGF